MCAGLTGHSVEVYVGEEVGTWGTGHGAYLALIFRSRARRTACRRRGSCWAYAGLSPSTTHQALLCVCTWHGWPVCSTIRRRNNAKPACRATASSCLQDTRPPCNCSRACSILQVGRTTPHVCMLHSTREWPVDRYLRCLWRLPNVVLRLGVQPPTNGKGEAFLPVSPQPCRLIFFRIPFVLQLIPTCRCPWRLKSRFPALYYRCFCWIELE